MDILTDSRRVNRLEVVETGRRRRWSDVEKLRIVEESFSGPRLVSETARCHGLSKQLLFSWRKAYREGQLGRSRCQVDGFVPARIVSEFPSTTERAAPAAMQRDICGTALPGKCFLQTFHPAGTVRSYVRHFSAVMDRWP